MPRVDESDAAPRQPHAVLDLATRAWKARKIERLLGLEGDGRRLRMLEVGAGSGGIAHYFATHPSGRFDVDAVDVVDSRLVTDGFRFTLVPGVALPFADGRFDVVISNHVIEHVGDAAAQAGHLREIRRVIAPDGVLYLAVPNRWMLVEPHFRLPFLSWLPRALRSPYVRMAGRGARYDCEPLTLPEVERLLAAAGFAFENIGAAALKETFAIERSGRAVTRWVLRIPRRLLDAARRINPTHVYRARPAAAGGARG